MTTLIDAAVDGGPQACRKVRPFILAGTAPTGRCRSSRTGQGVHQPVPAAGHRRGHLQYRLPLDVEGKAVLEAALGPLSAPAPVDGERDLRTSDRRRGDALLTLVRRAVAAGDEGGKTNQTTLLLTMGYDDLRAGLGAATTVGGLDAGTHLAPETVRRLCCDGSVIPPRPRRPRRGARRGLGRRFFTPPRPDGCGCATAGAPTRAATPRHSGPTDTTCSTGQITAPPTWATPPCSASGTARSCPPAAYAGRVYATSRGTRRVGPGPGLLRRPPRPTVREQHRGRTSVAPPHTPPHRRGRTTSATTPGRHHRGDPGNAGRRHPANQCASADVQAPVVPPRGRCRCGGAAPRGPPCRPPRRPARGPGSGCRRAPRPRAPPTCGTMVPSWRARCPRA